MTISIEKVSEYRYKIIINSITDTNIFVDSNDEAQKFVIELLKETNRIGY